MSNISSIISGHNKNLLNPNKDYKFYFAVAQIPFKDSEITTWISIISNTLIA